MKRTIIERTISMLGLTGYCKWWKKDSVNLKTVQKSHAI